MFAKALPPSKGLLHLPLAAAPAAAAAKAAAEEAIGRPSSRSSRTRRPSPMREKVAQQAAKEGKKKNLPKKAGTQPRSMRSWMP